MFCRFVLFSAPNCPACQAIEKAFHELAQDFEDSAILAKVSASTTHCRVSDSFWSAMVKFRSLQHINFVLQRTEGRRLLTNSLNDWLVRCKSSQVCTSEGCLRGHRVTRNASATRWPVHQPLQVAEFLYHMISATQEQKMMRRDRSLIFDLSQFRVRPF